jgi:hypothetical protein
MINRFNIVSACHLHTQRQRESLHSTTGNKSRTDLHVATMSAMLATASRAAMRIAPRAAAPRASLLSRSFAAGTFEERERGEETVYFRGKEAEQLKKLLKKMEKKEDDGRDALLEILGKEKLPESTIQALLDWKHHD